MNPSAILLFLLNLGGGVSTAGFGPTYFTVTAEAIVGGDNPIDSIDAQAV